MGIMDALGGKKKPSEGPGIDVELGEKAHSMKQAGGALKEPDPEKPAPVGKPSPMKPTQTPYGTGEGAKRGEKKLPVEEWLKDAPKMHKGGMVKKTGPHMLLKGEAVLSKKDTKKVGALGGQASGPSESPDGMSIDKMDDNTFSINHRHNVEQGPDAPKRKTKFTARNVKHLVRHVKQHFGGQAEPDEDEA